MTGNRTEAQLCLIAGAILLAIAGIIVAGAVSKVGPPAETWALFGLAFWCLSGAVRP